MKVRKHRKLITVVIILIVAIVMFASFFGIKRKDNNGNKVDLLPSQKLGMEFEKTRIINANVSQETTKTIYDSEGQVVQVEEGKEYTEEAGYKTVETPVNDISLQTLENYKQMKKIIEMRLKGIEATQYFIELNEQNGNIQIQIPEDENADEVESFIKNTSGLVLLDGETFENVFDSSYLKKAEVAYSQGNTETAVFLQLSFNEEGTKKLQELNKIYVETTTTETTEEGEEKEVTNSKTVWVFLNGSFIGTTVLPNIVYDNKIMFTFGLSNNSNEIQEAVENAELEAVLLNSGTPKLQYEYSNEVKNSEITSNQAFIYLLAIGTVFVIAYIFLVIKFKAKGFISVYFQVGFLGALLLVIRLTNTIITIEGVAGIIISMVLEFIFTYIVLTNLVKNTEGMYKKSNLTFFLNTIPLYAIAIVFTFATRTHISSFGMTLFWGILMIYVYNFIFSKFIFENLSVGGHNENN